MRELNVEDVYKGSKCYYCKERIWYDDNSDDWYKDGGSNRCNRSPYNKHVEDG